MAVSAFAVLSPGSRLRPHCGSTNARLTCHFGVRIPPGARIRAGEETRTWTEGDCVVFDDSFEHEVWQQGSPDSVRVVLLIRFWHPDIPPNRWPEAQHHMKKLYRQHKRRITVPPLERPAKLGSTPVLDLKH